MSSVALDGRGCWSSCIGFPPTASSSLSENRQDPHFPRRENQRDPYELCKSSHFSFSMTSLFAVTGKWKNGQRRSNLTFPAKSTVFDPRVQDNENGCRFISYRAGLDARKIRRLRVRRQLLAILMFVWDCSRREMEPFKLGPAYG